MTTHAYNRTSTVRRPATGTDTGTTIIPGAPARRPLPRWLAPAGLAIAVSVAGIGALVYDGGNEPAPVSTTAIADSTVGNGEVPRPGMPDGYFQPAGNASSTAPVANYGCKTSGPC